MRAVNDRCRADEERPNLVASIMGAAAVAAVVVSTMGATATEDNGGGGMLDNATDESVRRACGTGRCNEAMGSSTI